MPYSHDDRGCCICSDLYHSVDSWQKALLILWYHCHDYRFGCVVVTVGTVAAGGLGAVIEKRQTIPGFFDFGIATRTHSGRCAAGSQWPALNLARLEITVSFSIISNVAWGLGYFGMPQVLLRFMAIGMSQLDLFPSYRYSLVVISLTIAVFIGVMGRSSLPRC